MAYKDEEGNTWVHGDGGPIIVLQSSVVASWQGASDWDNSLMGGGTVETDYDVICDCEEDVSVLRRYDRDMLVVADSELGAAFVPSPLGEVVILHPFGFDGGAAALVEQITATPSVDRFPFLVEDTTLRLLVGAEAAIWQWGYGYSEIAVTPGEKICTVYSSERAIVVVLRPTD